MRCLAPASSRLASSCRRSRRRRRSRVAPPGSSRRRPRSGRSAVAAVGVQVGRLAGAARAPSAPATSTARSWSTTPRRHVDRRGPGPRHRRGHRAHPRPRRRASPPAPRSSGRRPTGPTAAMIDVVARGPASRRRSGRRCPRACRGGRRGRPRRRRRPGRPAAPGCSRPTRTARARSAPGGDERVDRGRRPAPTGRRPRATSAPWHWFMKSSRSRGRPTASATRAAVGLDVGRVVTDVAAEVEAGATAPVLTPPSARR